MDRYAILALLSAKPGKEKEVEEFLKSAQPMANRRRAPAPGMRSSWDRASSASSIHSRTKRKKRSSERRHCQDVVAEATELFSATPQVEKVEILASKDPVPETVEANKPFHVQ